MKSSVRILAIALALAFLLLARTAFQDSPTSASEHIDLKDGEASFADPINGANEADYLGFGDAATATVYFYIKSDDLGTQVTASTMHVGGIPPIGDTADAGTLRGGTDNVYEFRGGHRQASVVDDVGNDSDGTTGFQGGVTNANVIAALDNAYCANQSLIYASYSAPTHGTKADTATTSIMVSGWGVSTTTTGVSNTNSVVGAATTVSGCAFDSARAMAGGAAAAGDVVTSLDVLPDDDRTAFIERVIGAVNAAEVAEAKRLNHALYSYNGVAAAKTTPARRYTDGATTTATDRDSVGGALRPVDSVTFEQVYTDGLSPVVDTADVTTPNFVTSADDGRFRLAFPAAGPAGITTLGTTTVTFTYDIVDEYQASDKTPPNAAYKAYTSGYGRAYVSSGSDSGQWVDIVEVKDVMVNADGEHVGMPNPTSNLFRGMVVITNDTDHEDDSTIYAQDGDTLTLQVFDENGNRSSDVLATATALIDDSPPTISDLSPADESIINDDELRISFTVNDDGAGSDFRNIEEVVQMVQVQARASSGDEPRGMGMPCTVAEGEDQIDNAGGNASRVGVLVAPANTKFTTNCGTIVDTGNGGKFNLIITAQDLAGNVTTHTTQLTIDKAKPTVEGNPSVGQAWDEDKNQAKTSANSILIEFSEALDVDTVAASDFTVAGYTIDSVEVVGTNDDDNKNLNKFVVLTLTEDLANNARPSVTVTGVNDVAGNTIEQATRTSDNEIKAVITVVPFTALIAEDGEQAISFTSDEALRSMGGGNSTKASVNGANLSVKVSDDTLGGSATFKQSTFDDSGTYGVIIQAVDIDGNVSKAGAVSVSDEAHELTDDVAAGAKFDVTLDNWPLADTGLDNNVAGEVKAYIGKTMVASSTGVVDWTGGDVELQANAGRSFDEGDTINLSYSYVHADQVIQVDVTEPTMTSIPEDNSETDNASRAIQFIWSEAGEYAGDSYKTVTLNSAMHEGPSGTSTDILDALTTHDSKTWVYTPAEDLAIGDHEFTVKATDAAGNSNEVSITITITERKPVEIGLRVGWNLISFPGMPKSTDVNDIFTSDTISVVSQYDGRRVSPFTVWTRGEDGSLSSSPAGRMSIDSGLGLWVLSTDGSPLEVVTTPDDVTQVPPSINLIPGWNLVAVILVSGSEVGVNEYLPEGAWSRAFRLNNLTGRFESFSPPAPSTTGEPAEAGVALKAGDALWVYATKAATIVPK